MTTDIIAVLQDIVGVAGVLTGEAITDRSLTWGTNQPCLAKAIVCPSDTGQVAQIMKACFERAQTVVPYGGVTNLVQSCATTPDDIALSFEKLNRIEKVDTTAHTMTAQAGVTMQQAQEAADQANLFFPVDIGARGNCMLGGNVSTNAGGTKVIRYGMIRDSVLGLEAVLADGTVLSSMNDFLKNNSGFDLKHLFVGTEGVLGLVTRLVFRLHVKPKSHNVALVACEHYQQVIDLLNKSKELVGNDLCGFEVMWDNYFHEVVEPVGRLSSPIPPNYSYYVIIEATGTAPGVDDEAFESALLQIHESGVIVDGAVAKSDSEREAIWAIRHEVEWVVRYAKIFDVSLPVADVDDYIDTVTTGLQADIEDARIITFGHLGDNNIHISVLCDGARSKHEQLIEKHVYEALIPYSGAISAEHGIGVEKKSYLHISRSKEEIELMKVLKRTLDPKNILNPGKVISVD